jgi:uncharacterized repeat protein (TIGR03803 family)
MTNSLQQQVLITLTVVLVLAVSVAQPAEGKTKFKVLYSFTGQDGGEPESTLIRDSEGNLYSSTAIGGSNECSFNGQEVGCGTIFRLDNTGTESVLYSFAGVPDGETPQAGLVRDREGNLYGTTIWGGTGSCSDDGLYIGCGTVFKLDTAGHETTLYSFAGQPDAANPTAAVILDAAGNIYGTTLFGGTSDRGAVFKVDTTGHETVFYSFTGENDGEFPRAALIRNQSGDLIGTAQGGGAYGLGTVFKLDASGAETTLYSFKGVPDGEGPVGALIFDDHGNLYGTTNNGGTGECNIPNDGCGTVFKLDRTGKDTVLYSFKGVSKRDGASPESALVRDADGNLYGTTASGGLADRYYPGGLGTVFKVNLQGVETVLYRFTASGDGNSPFAGLLRDKKGNLYGTASSGGNDTCDGSCGVVFKIIP